MRSSLCRMLDCLLYYLTGNSTTTGCWAGDKQVDGNTAMLTSHCSSTHQPSVQYAHPRPTCPHKALNVRSSGSVNPRTSNKQLQKQHTAWSHLSTFLPAQSGRAQPPAGRPPLPLAPGAPSAPRSRRPPAPARPPRGLQRRPAQSPWSGRSAGCWMLMQTGPPARGRMGHTHKTDYCQRRSTKASDCLVGGDLLVVAG